MGTQGLGFESRYPLANFLSLVLPFTAEWGQITQIAAILSSDGPTLLYAYEAVAVIASLVLNIYKSELKHSRRHYKKYLKPTPNNGQEAIHLSLYKAYWR